MIYTLKTLFITLRLGGIVFWEPPAFSLNDFEPGPPGDLARERIAEKKIPIARGIVLKALIEMDSHGHGELKLANLKDAYVYRVCPQKRDFQQCDFA